MTGRQQPTVDLMVEAGNWPSQGELEKVTNAIFEQDAINNMILLPEGCEVSLLFTDDQSIAGLNKKWRNKDGPTNVLSFATNEGIDPPAWSPMLGDIVLAYDTVAREAEAQNKSFKDHLSHLIVHGFLHLLGYDHVDDEQAADMEGLETKILDQLGIADPYVDA